MHHLPLHWMDDKRQAAFESREVMQTRLVIMELALMDDEVKIKNFTQGNIYIQGNLHPTYFMEIFCLFIYRRAMAVDVCVH